MARYGHESVATHGAGSFSRRASRYIFWSGLFWGVLSLAGFLFLLRFDLSPGYQISPSTHEFFTGVLFRGAELVLLSSVWGALLALPAVLLLFLSAPEGMRARRETSAVKLARVTVRIMQPLLCVANHILFLSLSLGSVPHYVRAQTEQPTFLSSYSKFFYEVFFSELSVDRSSVWKKTFAGTNPQALVVQVPPAMLADPTLMPRTEKALGNQARFFVDAVSEPAQLQQLVTGSPATDDKFYVPTQVPVDMFGGQTLAALGVQAEVAPESLPYHASSDPEKLRERFYSRRAFVQRRLLLSQPQLFLLLRYGMLTYLEPQWNWHDVVADDTASLARFLDNARNSDAAASVRVVQLSELQRGRSSFADFAVRTSGSVSEQEWKGLVHDLDFLVGRNLEALRDNRNLAIFVVPYPDGSYTPFSRILYKIPNGFSGASQAGPGDFKTDWVLARDLTQTIRPLLKQTTPFSPEVSVAGPEGMSCVEVRLPSNAADSDRSLRERVNERLLGATLESAEKDLRVSDASAFYPLGMYVPGGLCRLSGAGRIEGETDKLVLWKSTTDLERLQVTSRPESNVVLRDAFVQMELPKAAQPIVRKNVRSKARPRKQPTVVEPAVVENLVFTHALDIYALPPKQSGASHFVALPSEQQAEFVSAQRTLLLPLFEKIVRSQIIN